MSRVPKTKTSTLRARCSEEFKNTVLEFMRVHYPEEDEAWVVRNAVKQFMERQAPTPAIAGLNEASQTPAAAAAAPVSYLKPDRKKKADGHGPKFPTAKLKAIVDHPAPSPKSK